MNDTNNKFTLKKIAIPLLVGVSAIVLDLYTKWWASNTLAEKPIEIINDFFYFRLAHNSGAAFSLFADLDPAYRAAILLVVALATLVFMLIILWPIVGKSTMRLTVLALVIGGALGNQYDRFAQGYVVDFIDFIFFGWRYPTFNVADICVVVGFVFLAYWMFNYQKPEAKNKPDITAETPKNTATDNEKGFTLLEVMVAMAILAMSLTVILESHSRSMQMTNSVKYITIATQLARYQMIEVQVEVFSKGFSAFDEKLEGDFAELKYPNFRWEAEVKKPTLAIDLLTMGMGAMFGGGLGGEGEEGDLLGSALGMDAEQMEGLSGMGGDLGIGPESGMSGMMAGYFQTYIKEIEEAMRFVTLKIIWTEGRKEKSFSVATHIVNMPGSSPRPIVLNDLSNLTQEQREAVMKMAQQQGQGGGHPVNTGAPPTTGAPPVTTPVKKKRKWNKPPGFP